MKKCNCKESKCCNKILKVVGKVALGIAAGCAIAAAVLKLIDYFKSKKANKENEGREFKELFNFIGVKNFKLTDRNIAGVISKNRFGVTTIDLSEATFKEDGFISLSSVGSVVNIFVPEGINVKVDGLIKCTNINNTIDEIPGRPTLYIASKLKMSAIRVGIQE